MNTENNNNKIPVASGPVNSPNVPNYGSNQTSVVGQMSPNSVPVVPNVGLGQQPVFNGIPSQQSGVVSSNGMKPVSQQNLGNIPGGQTVSNGGPTVPNVVSGQQPVFNGIPSQQGSVASSNDMRTSSQQNLGNIPGGQASGAVNNIASSAVALDSQLSSNEVISSAPIPPKVAENATEELSIENPNGTHEVVEILSSSFDQKNKVNLLTPQQKEALTKKREEAFKEKESYQPKPVSKFMRVISALVFVLLFTIVFFLPNINSYIAEIRNPNKSVDNALITTGTLKCSLDKVDDKYNLSYSYDFDFTDSKLDQLTYVQATVGDELVDYNELHQRLDSCNNLKSMTKGLAGIKIACSLSSGVLTEEQIINYKTINHEQVTTAYVEAGGLFPEFESDTSIDMIERNMKAAGYTCERVK